MEKGIIFAEKSQGKSGNFFLNNAYEPWFGMVLVSLTGQKQLQEMDRKTRKIFTMNRSLHPRSDVDRLYFKRIEGERGLQCLEEVVKLEELSLAFYLSKKEEKLLNEVVKGGLFWETEDPNERKRQNTAERKKRFKEKVLHGQFERGTKEVKDQKGSWLWLNKGYLKKETEGCIVCK